MGSMLTSLLLLLLCVAIGSAQHWSYGLQPGGKRDAEDLIDSFQELANEMDEQGALQYRDCAASQQRPALRGLKGALASLIEQEAGQKKI